MLPGMDLDDDALYRAFRARDARFDGRVFVGVKTTGIYCRPVCPARTPKRENVAFYRSAAGAQEAGFRPCLRCRPETSPELGAWHGTSNTVARALCLVESGALDDGDVESLAERVGVGGRQLRRLFQEHLGASPIAVAQARRVHLAKQLVHDTDLPLAQIALASGFGSVRRFNESFQQLFGRGPSELRGKKRARAASTSHADSRGLVLELTCPEPYDREAQLAFLGMRAIPGVECVEDGAYVRTITGGGGSGLLTVSAGKSGRLRVSVRLATVASLPGVLARVRRVFDLAADPLAIGAHLSSDPFLARLVGARPGLRVPGAWDGFELAVRAVLGQQISVGAARKLLGRLVTICGEPVDSDVGARAMTHVFPSPERVVAADLSTLGVPRARAATLRAVASALIEDPALLSAGRELDQAVQRLRLIPGIGEWTAQYIAMRELREPDAFPAADAGLLRAVSRLEGRRVTPSELLERAERWRPFRSYAALHLWASLDDDPGKSPAGDPGKSPAGDDPGKSPAGDAPHRQTLETAHHDAVARNVA